MPSMQAANVALEARVAADPASVDIEAVADGGPHIEMNLACGLFEQQPANSASTSGPIRTRPESSDEGSDEDALSALQLPSQQTAAAAAAAKDGKKLISEVVSSTTGSSTTGSMVVAFHKPRGMEIEQGSAPTRGASGRRLNLNDEIARFVARFGAPAPGGRLSAVGRLDKDTTGLLLLTDDGRLSDRILWPGACTKVYEATVKLRRPHRPSSEQLARLVAGVELPDGAAAASAAELVSEHEEPPVEPAFVSNKKEKKAARKRRREEGGDGGDGGGGGGGGDAPASADAAPPTPPAPFGVFVVRVSVSMGRNRVVRRLLAAVGLPVSELHRMRIGPLSLSGLGIDQPGDACLLSAEQQAALRAAAPERERVEAEAASSV